MTARLPSIAIDAMTTTEWGLGIVAALGAVAYLLLQLVAPPRKEKTDRHA